MKELTSLKNPVVQAARALQTAKERARQGAFLCDGEHMVTEALSVCPGRVRILFVDKDCVERFAALLHKAPVDAQVYAVPESVMEAISQVKTPQGIAAVVALPESVPLDHQQGRLMLLENVQDPGNVGTILRTLDAAGFAGCILTPGCADPYAPKALRATMGSALRIPITFADSAAQAVKTLNQRGYATIAASLDGQPFYEREALGESVCVLIGNEGQGLTPEAQAACSHRYKLPMRGGAESLNAGIAAAVMMYDLMNR
ncbi:MAG: RNA methyltransferase [Clostridiales bacterium]|nr:RNA methyltransferase [Clostridiales bacterium]